LVSTEEEITELLDIIIESKINHIEERNAFLKNSDSIREV
jgi:hypothetical protein